jgi:molybdopterin/thiamine biosynthesis adenylyltransferase
MKGIYEQCFNRNIGNLTQSDQRQLKESSIAFAGIGGVGGTALVNIARMGVGEVKIADPETYAYSDINRQQGATVESVDRKKVDVLAEQVRRINPDIKVTAYDIGLSEENIEEFLSGASIVIDGLEFFCMSLRKQLFDRARNLGIHVLSSPILGFGTSLAVFSPTGPTFEDCFGPIPADLDINYLINYGRSFFPKLPKYIDMVAYFEAMKENRPIPSIATSTALSGAVTAAEAIFILLHKRSPACFPLVRRFDLFEASIHIEDSRRRAPGPFKKLALKLLFNIKKPAKIPEELIEQLL